MIRAVIAFALLSTPALAADVKPQAPVTYTAEEVGVAQLLAVNEAESQKLAQEHASLLATPAGQSLKAKFQRSSGAKP